MSRINLKSAAARGQPSNFDETEVDEKLRIGDWRWDAANGPMAMRSRDNEYREFDGDDAERFGNDLVRSGWTFVGPVAAEHYLQNGEFPTKYSAAEAMASGIASGGTMSLSKVIDRQAFEKERDHPWLYAGSSIVSSLLTSYGGARGDVSRLFGPDGNIKSASEVTKNILLGKAPGLWRNSPASAKTAADIMGQVLPTAVAARASRAAGDALLYKAFKGRPWMGMKELYRTPVGITSALVTGGVDAFLWGAGTGFTEATVMKNLGIDDAGEIAEMMLETGRKNAIWGAATSGLIAAGIGLIPLIIPAGAKATAGAWDWAADTPFLRAGAKHYTETVARVRQLPPGKTAALVKYADPGQAGREARNELQNVVENLDDYYRDTTLKVEKLFSLNSLLKDMDEAPWRESFVEGKLQNANTIQTLLIAHSDFTDIINDLSTKIGDQYDIEFDGPRPRDPDIDQRKWHIPEHEFSVFPPDVELLKELRGPLIERYKRFFGSDGHFTERLRGWIRESNPNFDPNNIMPMENMAQEILKHRYKLEREIDGLGQFVPEAIKDLEDLVSPYVGEFNEIVKGIREETPLFDIDTELKANQIGINQTNKMEDLKARRGEDVEKAWDMSEHEHLEQYIDPESLQLFNLLDTEMRARYPVINEPIEDYMRERGVIPINNSVRSLVNFSRAVANHQPVLPMLSGWWQDSKLEYYNTALQAINLIGAPDTELLVEGGISAFAVADVDWESNFRGPEDDSPEIWAKDVGTYISNLQQMSGDPSLKGLPWKTAEDILAVYPTRDHFLEDFHQFEVYGQKLQDLGFWDTEFQALSPAAESWAGLTANLASLDLKAQWKKSFGEDSWERGEFQDPSRVEELNEDLDSFYGFFEDLGMDPGEAGLWSAMGQGTFAQLHRLQSGMNTETPSFMMESIELLNSDEFRNMPLFASMAMHLQADILAQSQTQADDTLNKLLVIRKKILERPGPEIDEAEYNQIGYLVDNIDRDINALERAEAAYTHFAREMMEAPHSWLRLMNDLISFQQSGQTSPMFWNHGSLLEFPGAKFQKVPETLVREGYKAPRPTALGAQELLDFYPGTYHAKSAENWQRNLRELPGDVREQVIGSLKHQLDGIIIHEKYHRQIAGLRKRARTLFEEISLDAHTGQPLDLQQILAESLPPGTDPQQFINEALASGQTIEDVITNSVGLARDELTRSRPLDPSQWQNRESRVHSVTADYLEKNPEALGNLLKGTAPEQFIDAYAKVKGVSPAVITLHMGPGLIYEEYLAHKIQYLMHPLSMREIYRPNEWTPIGEYFFRELGAIDYSSYQTLRGLGKKQATIDKELNENFTNQDHFESMVPNEELMTYAQMKKMGAGPGLTIPYEIHLDRSWTGETIDDWPDLVGPGGFLDELYKQKLEHYLDPKHTTLEAHESRSANDKVSWWDGETWQTDYVPKQVTPEQWEELRKAIHDYGDPHAMAQVKKMFKDYAEYKFVQDPEHAGMATQGSEVLEIESLDSTNLVGTKLGAELDKSWGFAADDMGRLRESVASILDTIESSARSVRQALIVFADWENPSAPNSQRDQLRRSLKRRSELSGEMGVNAEAIQKLQNDIGPVGLQGGDVDPYDISRWSWDAKPLPPMKNADVIKDKWIQDTLGMIQENPILEKLWRLYGSAQNIQKFNGQMADLRMNKAKSEYFRNKNKELYREISSTDRAIENLQEGMQNVHSGKVPDILQAMDMNQLLTLSSELNPTGTAPNMLAELWIKLYESMSEIHKAAQAGRLQETQAMENMLEFSAVNRIRNDLGDEAWGTSTEIDPSTNIPTEVPGMADVYNSFKNNRKDLAQRDEQHKKEFGQQVGTNWMADQQRVEEWVHKVTQNSIVPETDRMDAYIDMLIAELENLWKSHDISKMDPIHVPAQEAIKGRAPPEKGKGFFGHRAPELIDTKGRPGRPARAAMYIPAEAMLESMIKDLRDLQRSQKGTVDEILTTIATAKYLMKLPEGRRAIHELMTIGGLASFYGGPMLGFITNALEGFLDPVSLVTRLHTLEILGRGTKTFTDDFFLRWVNWMENGFKGSPWSRETMGKVTPPGEKRRYARWMDDEWSAMRLARTFVSERGALYWSEENNKPERKIDESEYGEAYGEASKALTVIGSNFDIMSQLLDKAIEPIIQAAPEIAKEIRIRLESTITHLFKTMPRSIPGGFFQDDLPPSDAEIIKWLSRLEISEKPMKMMLHRVANGILTPEEVETGDALAPAIMSTVRSRFMDTVTDFKGELPENIRMALAVLFKGTVIPAEYTGMAQAIFKGPQEEEKRPPRAKKPRIPEAAGGPVPGASFRMSEIG